MDRGCRCKWLANTGTFGLFLSCVAGCTALSPPPPPEVVEHYRPRVVMGVDLVYKTLVCEIPEPIVANTIRCGDLDPAPGKEIGIVGMNGAVLMGSDGTELWSARFEDKPWRKIRGGWFRNPAQPVLERFRIVDLDRDGSCEYVSYRDRLGNLVVAVDHEGNQLWTHPLPNSSGGMWCDWGDLNGDGNLEVVAYSSPKLVAIDSAGNLLWETEVPDSFAMSSDKDGEDASHPYGLFVADVMEDERPEITLFLGGFFNCVCVRVFDATGHQLIAQELPLALQLDFTRVCNSTSSRNLTLFAAEDDAYRTGIEPQHSLFTFPDFKVIRRYDTPIWFDPLVARVKLDPNKPPYLAIGLHVLGAHISRGLLYFYDDSGTRVYEERVESELTAFTTVPGETEGSEVLLAVTSGETEKIWQYSAADN